MTTERKIAYLRFLRWNGLFLGGAFLFLLLDRFSLFDGWLLCPLHLIGLYCPTCGMTRAAHALVRLELLSVLRYNPCLLPLLATVGYYEGVALCSAHLGRTPLLRGARRWPIAAMLGLLGAFFVARNLLLLFGVDPLGDFL